MSLKSPDDKMTNWTNDKIINFLELLENEKVIWDTSNKSHKLKHKVHEGWLRISSAMDIPVEELKNKKKSLMASFRPLIKKKINSVRSGSDDVFQPVWFAFDTMERFLGNMYDVDETVYVEEDYYEVPEQSQKPNLDSPSKLIYSKRPKNSELCLDAEDKEINDSFNTVTRVLDERGLEDECDIYARLLAKKLRKYPGRLRDRIMYKIDGLLLDNPYPEEQPSSYFHS